jgi:hypothetical protein
MAIRISNSTGFDGVYCEDSLGYYESGAFVGGGTRQIYNNRDDATKQIFYEIYGTINRWTIAQSYNGFNQYTNLKHSALVPPPGVWGDGGLTITQNVDCSSSSSSCSSVSQSSSSSCSCSSSSSSLDNLAVSAFSVGGLTQAQNGVYCAFDSGYYDHGSWVSGGSRLRYQDPTNDLFLFYNNYAGGWWILANEDLYDGQNEIDLIQDNGTTPPTGSWDGSAVIATATCGSSSSSSSSSCSCSCSSSSSSSSSSSCSSWVSSSSNSCSSSSCSSWVSSSSSSSVDPFGAQSYKITGFETSGYNGVYCPDHVAYFLDGAFVAGGSKFVYENAADATKILFYEEREVGRWVLAPSTYNGFNKAVSIPFSADSPPIGVWGNDDLTLITAACGSSSSSSSLSSSSSSMSLDPSPSSSSSCSCSSSSADSIIEQAYKVTGTADEYSGIYCATGGKGYWQTSTLSFVTGGSRWIYTHRDNNELFRLFYSDYDGGLWILANENSYGGDNPRCYVFDSGTSPATGAYNGYGGGCTITAAACNSSSSSSSCSSSSSSCSSSSSG